MSDENDQKKESKQWWTKKKIPNKDINTYSVDEMLDFVSNLRLGYKLDAALHKETLYPNHENGGKLYKKLVKSITLENIENEEVKKFSALIFN